MKVTKSYIKQLVKEELSKVLNEEKKDYSSEIINALGLQGMQRGEFGELDFDTPQEAKAAQQKLSGLAIQKVDDMNSKGLVTAQGAKELKAEISPNNLVPSDNTLKFAQGDVGKYYSQKYGLNDMSGKTPDIDSAFRDLKDYLSAAAMISRKMGSYMK